MGFFEDLTNEALSGVAFKNIYVKREIVSYFCKHGNCTIADLCVELGLSTPKINDVILDLITEGLVKDYGKLESNGGRRPNLYGLVDDYGYYLGVDVKRANINIAVSNLSKDLVYGEMDIPFTLSNDEDSLESLCAIINTFINELPFSKEKIIGAGVSLPGRINHHTGRSFNSFHFKQANQESLSETIKKNIGLKVFLENDSRAMALAEFSAGAARGYENVLFLNVGHGLGVGIIISGKLYYGKSGFSGEFGHIPFYDNEVICTCGKKGCLETEASGWALVNNFKSKLSKGYSSTLNYKTFDDIKLPHIIDAAINDDVLAIELLAEIGEKLGKGISVLINIFNPEIVVLGGLMAKTGDIIKLPIKSALNKYSLSLVSNDTPLEMTEMKDKGGVLGACLLVRNQLLNMA
jgi:glucokinase-like ROK family protein